MSAFKRLARWLPLLIIVIALVAVLYFRLYEYITFDMLAKHHNQLQAWTQQHYALVVVLYMLVYIFFVTISIPGATLLTLAGGYLFGAVFGSIYVVVSATIGACLIFLAIKTSVGQWLAEKAEGWVAKLEKGFQKNAFNYLLFLRLVPVFPFWVINIVPAVLDVKLRHYFLATLIGIIPGTVVYALLGDGLGSIFAADEQPDLSIIFQTKILIPIILLGLLALVPVVYKSLASRKKHA